MNKKILIPLPTTSAVKEPIARTHMCRATYLRKVMGAGFLPLLISPLTPDDLLEQALTETAGILLVGGEDVDPMYYNAERHHRTQPADPDRDRFEINIANIALKRRIPLFGICRGIQVINVASGGTLIQHVPDVVPNEQHGISEGKSYEHIAESEKHVVTLVSGTRTAAILNKEAIHTNSAHHQAVDQLGNDFIIAGRSLGGIVEIIEHSDSNYFAFAVQSHPEAENGDLEPLLNKFFEAVRE